ncbi:MAG: type II toxin-antitoxin system RelB/DinJ family antitoxin [Eubacteriales bacterium]|nr:type II toxin-antitoxin system RelB/DinJ family antitoxin [Eubacteriales bacterium]
MEKTTTLNLRVNPTIKQNAEAVLKQLGIPMATAVDMFLRQVSLTGSIPFSLSLPKAPVSINTDDMTTQELRSALQAGYQDMQAGRVQDASSAFAAFRESHK